MNNYLEYKIHHHMCSDMDEARNLGKFENPKAAFILTGYIITIEDTNPYLYISYSHNNMIHYISYRGEDWHMINCEVCHKWKEDGFPNATINNMLY